MENPSLSYKIWFSCSIVSILMGNFGIVKYFKNGPTWFLHSYITWKTLATFLSVFFLNFVKIALLGLFQMGRIMENILYSVSNYENQRCPELTLIFVNYTHKRTLFGLNFTSELFDVFQQLEGTKNNQETILVHDRTNSNWKTTANWSCAEPIFTNSLQCAGSCLERIPSESSLTCGNWVVQAFILPNSLLWAPSASSHTSFCPLPQSVQPLESATS